MSLISIRDLAVRKGGRTLLDIPELAVEPQEILVILGPTGAGKSTLLRVFNLLEEPTVGRVLWQDAPVPRPAPLALRRRMAMVFQDPLLFSGTTFENVAYGLRLRGIRGAEQRRRVEEVLRLFRIEELAERRARTLSGGEAQRTSLARSLVLHPELLLLDEPLAALDAPIRERLLMELKAIIRAQGITCVYVTHEQAEAFALADRIAILHHGRLRQVGTPEEVFYRPQGRFVAEFVRTGNIWPGTVVRRGPEQVELAVAGWTLIALGAPQAVRVEACVRPEEIRVLKAPAPRADEGENRLEGILEDVVDEGPTIRLRLDCGFPLSAVVTRRVAGDLHIEAGDRLVVTFPARSVHLIPTDEEVLEDASIS